MGFETPLWLLSLLVGVLPIIAHRIRQRDLRRLRLPTFVLLAQAQAQQRSKRRLSDVLLLVTRIALLLLLAFALSAPYTYASVSFGDGEVSSTVIVVDDSMSMRRLQGGSTLLDQAVRRATEVVAALPNGSEAGIVLSGSPARILLEKNRDLNLVTRSLRRITPADRATDLDGGIALALQQLEGAQQGKRRLLVLSDFARHVRLAEAPITSSGVEVRFEALGKEGGGSNLAITQVVPTPIPSGDPAQTSLAVEVQAFGQSPQRATLRAVVHGQQQPEVPLTFANRRAHATLQVPKPLADQDPIIELQLSPGDALTQDDHYQILLSGSGGLRLLLVNGDPQPGSRSDELFYLDQALRLLPERTAVARMRSLDAASLEHEDLSQNDVVLLANVPAPSTAVAERLAEFVRGGGGLIIAAGNHVQAQPYNDRLQSLLPGHISAASQTKDVALNSGDAQTPLAAGLPGLSQVRTWRRLLVDTAAPVLLRFTDGSPAAAAHEVGRGRVVLFCSSLDDDWTDLPIRPGFMPLSAALIRYAAGDRALFAGRYHAGDRVQIPVPAGAHVVEVVAPDGTRARFDGLKQPLLGYRRTADSGAYRVLAGSLGAALHFVPERSFVVERPDEESDTRAAAAQGGPSLDGGPQGARQSQVQKPLAPTLWLVCALLAVLEAALRLGSFKIPRWRPQRA